MNTVQDGGFSTGIAHNKKDMSRILLTLLYVLISGSIYSQNHTGTPFMPAELKRVVILQPTGETINELPEMAVMSDTTARHKKVMANIKNSFVNEFLDLYFIAQVYLKNKHQLDRIEPAYLALTENQGGFAKFGFSIKEKNGHVSKKKYGLYRYHGEAGNSGPK